MKRLLIILGIAVFGWTMLVACGENNKPRAISIRGGGDARVPPGTPTDPNGQITFQPPANMGTTWGQVTAIQSQTDEQFTNLVRHLLSASIDPTVVGMVSGQPNQTTGVRIWGYVPVNPSTIASDVSLSGTVSSSAQFFLGVWDSYMQGKYQELPIGFRGGLSGTLHRDASGLVTADIRFDDGPRGGYIRLTGTVGNNGGQAIFSGDIAFNNYVSVSQSYPVNQEVRLGSFAVQACGFFICK